jgi:hypothetical protein
MGTLPENRNTGNTAAEHAADHNTLHTAFNDQRITLRAYDHDGLGGTTRAVEGGVPVIRYQTAVDGQATALVQFPDDWATCHVDILWTTQAAGAGDVVWRANYAEEEEGALLDAAFVNGADVTLAPAGGAFPFIKTRLLTSFALTAGRWYRFQVERRAAAGGDTFNQGTELFATQLSKAS